MSNFVRYAFGIGIFAALFAGCSGNSVGRIGQPLNDVTANVGPHQRTFHYIDAEQRFKVPAGVRHITVVALGAHGAGSPITRGGRVHAVIPVNPGEVLVVFVGGDAIGANGGFNGGANSGDKDFSSDGYGGGGASDVRQGGDGLRNRIVVAGGGGGDGGDGYRYPGGEGGKGGGYTGGDGQSRPSQGGAGGGGGTQDSGGSGGTAVPGEGPGSDGSLGAGGTGGSGCYTVSCESGGSGGGGGGGYYGGGGGGTGGADGILMGAGGGGGGGSSYAERRAIDVRTWRGWDHSAGNGLVVFSWQ